MKEPGLQPILVLCIGNLIMGDDGLGVHFARLIARRTLPPGVELFEGGTAGLNLLDILKGREKVIIIDAIRADQPPGTVLRIDVGAKAARANQGISMHHLGILDVLAAADCLGTAPGTTIAIGAVPADISPKLELSSAVSNALPVIERRLMAELNEE